MRARNLKPSIFRNELLAVADPLNTLVFQGLWCLADRAGRLEDRPAKIHLEINPGRAYETTTAALSWLGEHGFIRRYSVDGTAYILVVNFEKHQNPHHREPPSTIPAPGQTEAIAPFKEEKPGASPSLAVLTPDSGFLTPDSGLLTPDSPIPRKSARTAPRRAARDDSPGQAPTADAELPPGLDPAAWKRWRDYRVEIRKPLKPVSIPAAQRELAAFGCDQSAVVDQSIAHGWQGLFPLKRTNGAHRPPDTPRRRLRTPDEIEAEENARAQQ